MKNYKRKRPPGKRRLPVDRGEYASDFGNLMRAAGFWLFACIIAGCGGTGPPPTVPMVADVLIPPANFGVFLKARAKGVQIYECKAAKNDSSRYEWAFREPVADLFDVSGAKIGVHYSGPSWEHNDGSVVVAKVGQRIDSAERDSIPWLLLVATQSSPTGTFSKVRVIQQLETVGGGAPRSGCNASAVGKEAKVSFTANFYFYAPR